VRCAGVGALEMLVRGRARDARKLKED